MNTKETIPVIAKIAPPLLIGVAVYYGLKWLVSPEGWFFSTEGTEKKPEIAPADAEAENRRKEAETTVFRQISAEIPARPVPESVLANGGAESRRKEAETALKTPAFRPIPAEIPAKPAAAPAAVAVPKIVTQALPLTPIKKKFVTREDLATVFQRGACALTRTEAVAALKKLGFGKTAAYAALTPDGRFSAWLHFAPDGIITWTE